MLDNLSTLKIVTLNDFAMSIVNYLKSYDASDDDLSDFSIFLNEHDKFDNLKQKLIGKTLEEKYIEWNCLYENKTGDFNWIINTHSEYLGHMQQDEYFELISSNMPYVLEQITEIKTNNIQSDNSLYNIEKYLLESEELTR